MMGVWGSQQVTLDRHARYQGVFGSSMPDLKLENPQVQQEMFQIAKFWLDLGVDESELDDRAASFQVRLPDGALSEFAFAFCFPLLLEVELGF